LRDRGAGVVAACKTGHGAFAATVAKVEPHNDAAIVLELDVGAAAPVFLPGQYVNIGVPGSGQHRSYSFSSAPGDAKLAFLIKKIPGGVMSTWLETARAGDTLELDGPLGSFYLREVARPLLFLAGGTGSRRSCRCSRCSRAAARSRCISSTA
jgi:benzoate/toluate 1,2-dioxygenase reductase subunit